MNKKEIKKALKDFLGENKGNMDTYHMDEDNSGSIIQSIFIGTYMHLDPCGRYHHLLSPNGVSQKCITYWERLDKAAEEIGCWLSAGDNGDLCDMFLNRLPENMYTTGSANNLEFHFLPPDEVLEGVATGLFIQLDELVRQYEDLIITAGSIANDEDKRVLEQTKTFISNLRDSY